MVALPPGTLLQLLYLRERLKQLPAGRFIEIGPGGGDITNLLLMLGWSGFSYDLDPKTIEMLGERFHDCIEDGRLVGVNKDFVVSPPPSERVDLVISCMVMEHMEEKQELEFMNQSARCLKEDGLMIGLVPASPLHWGIEDEIAGHYRRYTRKTLGDLMQKSGWRIIYNAGLTYPVSNMLLPVSNYLVNRNERPKLELSALERTKQSGRRHVKFKTHFPSFIGLLLNEFTLLPFHWLQKIFADSDRALVLYFEAQCQNQD